MEKMSFKTFIWPQNPHTYREKWEREPIYSRNDLDYQVFEEMGPMKRTITGQGVFFGETAFASFRALAALFEDKTTGTLNHPVWGNRNVYFTELELTQEPKENYVSYSFTFREADSDGVIPA